MCVKQSRECPWLAGSGDGWGQTCEGQGMGRGQREGLARLRNISVSTLPFTQGIISVINSGVLANKPYARSVARTACCEKIEL